MELLREKYRFFFQLLLGKPQNHVSNGYNVEAMPALLATHNPVVSVYATLHMLKCYPFFWSVSGAISVSRIYFHVLISIPAPEDYGGTSILLTFSPNISNVQVPVPIINDDIVENDETFFGVLDNLGLTVVMTDPALATVLILEDNSDSKCTPFYI